MALLRHILYRQIRHTLDPLGRPPDRLFVDVESRHIDGRDATFVDQLQRDGKLLFQGLTCIRRLRP